MKCAIEPPARGVPPLSGRNGRGPLLSTGTTVGLVGLAALLLAWTLLSGALVAAPLTHSAPAQALSKVRSNPSPLNTTVVPCSLLNYTIILAGYVVGQSWNASELANVTHYSEVVSSWWNETCTLPAFVSMAQAHMRNPWNFTDSGGNDGVYTSHANLSAGFGANWLADGMVHEELWYGVIKNGTTENVTGPVFTTYFPAYSGPGGPMFPHNPAVPEPLGMVVLLLVGTLFVVGLLFLLGRVRRRLPRDGASAAPKGPGRSGTGAVAGGSPSTSTPEDRTP